MNKLAPHYFLFFSLFCLTPSLFADDLQSIAKPKTPEQQEIEPPKGEPPLPVDGADVPILKELRGLHLVGHPSLVRKWTSLADKGISTEELKIPGGEESLIKRLAPFLNKPLSQKEINKIKRAIILYYREEHHPVVMVFVPEQKITNGILQLVIIEGRVGRIDVRGNHHTPTQRILNKIHLKPGETIDEQRLLRDIDWINSNPFRSANILFSPGEKNGTTNVDINMRERKPWRLYAGGDNTGSAHTGEARWFSGINVNNALFPDNIFSYQFTSASNIRRFQSHTMQYVAPMPWRHTLSLFGAYAFIHPDLPFSQFKSRGKSYQASARYEASIWQTYPTYQQQLTVGFDFKGTNNNLVFGPDNIQIEKKIVNITQFVFGYHLGIDTSIHKMAGGIEIFWSPCQMIANQEESNFEALNPFAQPEYLYGRMSYSHTAMLPRRYSLFGQARAQVSSGSLIASEQFALGGYNTVRGYPERVVNGDNALCVNFEVRSPPFSILSHYFAKVPKDSIFFLLFTDFGYASDNYKLPGLPKAQTLLGAGPGMRYNIGPYFNARLDLGYPCFHVRSASNKPHIHFSAVFSY